MLIVHSLLDIWALNLERQSHVMWMWSELILCFSPIQTFLDTKATTVSLDMCRSDLNLRNGSHGGLVLERKEEEKHELFSASYFVSWLPSDCEQRWRVKGCRREQTSAASALSAFCTFFLLLLLLLQNPPQSLLFAFGLSLPHLISNLKKHLYSCNPGSGTHLCHNVALYPCQNPD